MDYTLPGGTLLGMVYTSCQGSERAKFLLGSIASSMGPPAWLFGISGMEWLKGIVEWNSGISEGDTS